MDDVEKILCYLWELRTSFELVARPDVHEVLNIPLEKLSMIDKLQAIKTALAKRLIKIDKVNVKDVASFACTNLQSRPFIEAICPEFLLDTSCVPFLALTSRGGQYWEQMTQPNWELFFTEGDSVFYHDSLWINIKIGAFKFAEYILKNMICCFPEAKGDLIHPLPSWCPVYWKKPISGYDMWLDTGLPSDNTMSHLINNHGISMGNEMAALKLSVLYSDWYQSLWKNYY